MLKFYANINGSNEGPFSIEELKDLVKQKKITKKTYILLEGTDEWVTAKEVGDLFPSNSTMPDLPPLPPGESSPLTSDDAARMARQGAAAAKQGAQMAVAYGVSITSKSTGFWGAVTTGIRRILNENLMSAIIAKLSQVGIYAMVLAAVGILGVGIIGSVKMSQYALLVGAIFMVVALSLTQYFASRFMDSGVRVISNTPTQMGSDALIEAIALITFVLSLGALVVGVILTLQDGLIGFLVSGLAIFLSGVLVTGISLNPRMLNIHIGETASAGEEAIGIISFGYKSWLRAVPAIFGVLSILGSLQLVWALIKIAVGDDGVGMAVFTSGSIMVFVGGLFPVLGLLVFLFSYLTIDVIASILSLPGKLDAIKSQKQ